MNDIEAKIKSANNILIISHRSPDSDALGSSLAMFFYLKSLDKNPLIFNVGPIPSYFSFLPGLENIFKTEKILDYNFDLIITLDLASTDHAGIDEKIFKNNYVINIDHHLSNDFYGQLNLIDSGASSTCEVIYNFFSEVKFFINKNTATCLLCGILGDTGCFSNSATNLNSISISAELISKGAKIHAINNQINKNKSLNGLRLWGKVLARLKNDSASNITYTYITEEDYLEYQVAEEELDGLTNFLNFIGHNSFVALFKIGANLTKVSMRTIRDDINLSDIDKINGGGGHQKAAGFAIKMSLNENSDLLSFLKKDGK